MKKITLSFLLLGLISQSFGQTEQSAFTATGRAGVATTFVTDYQAIGINASNLGWASKYEGKKFALGFMEQGYSVFSQALTKTELRESVTNFNSADFTLAEKINAAQQFADAGFGLNVDVMTFGFYFGLPKVGGFAISSRERAGSYMSFSKQASDILFLGFNADYFDQKFDSNGSATTDPDQVAYATSSQPTTLSSILGDSRISASWLREYNVSYGRALIENEKIALYVGAGAKYVQGFAMVDMRIDDGKLIAFSSMSPGFGIDFGGNPTPSQVEQSGTLPTAVGSGMGFDLGANLVLGEKLKVGLAINDIGNVTWNGNVYEVLDTDLTTTSNEGINNYNVLAEFGNLLQDSSLFSWKGVQEVKTSLPTHIRAGASYVLGSKIEVGVDAVVPGSKVPGNYNGVQVGAGIDIKLLPVLTISTGVVSSDAGFNLPIGLVFRTGKGGYEAGIASRDVITFFTENGPMLSFSTGFLRFRF